MFEQDNWMSSRLGKFTASEIGNLLTESKKKDEVFGGLKNNAKLTKSTLPAATQIFTPDWIVRYMVDNSLGIGL